MLKYAQEAGAAWVLYVPTRAPGAEPEIALDILSPSDAALKALSEQNLEGGLRLLFGRWPSLA